MARSFSPMQTSQPEKFITDDQGNRIAVVLEISVYEKLLDDLDEFYCAKAYEDAVLETDVEIKTGNYTTLDDFLQSEIA